MALRKNITQSNGITTNYHKINRIALIDNNGEVPAEERQPLILTVDVVSYLNEEYRDACESIMVRTYGFNISPDEEVISIRSLGYTKLKELELFKEAEDC